MRFLDYLRLGFAGVRAHKKRTFTVVIIVGLLFSMVAAGAFVLQGLENAMLGTMLAPTGGKVLVMSAIEPSFCGKGCDVAAEVEAVKEKIGKYGGELIPAEASQTTDGMFYKLEENVFVGAHDKSSSDVTEVVVPLEVAAKLAGMEMPERGAETAEKLAAIEEVRAEVLRKVVEGETGERYYIAEILPSGVYASSLSFMSIEQAGNPLDLILSQVRTGVSQNFIGGSIEVGSDEGERPSGFIAAEDVKTEEMGVVFAEFSGVEAAYNYYRDEANYCSEVDRAFKDCGKDYKYLVVSAISDPLTTYENLQNVWLVFKIAALVLAVIALIIAVSTYARLISKDMKIIALYHATGATKGQIRKVYAVYLMMLSLMAVAFAVLAGLGLAAVLSMVNMEALGQVFALGFGVEAEGVWLIGWNNLIWCLVGAMILAAVVAVALGNGNFTSKELARKMK